MAFLLSLMRIKFIWSHLIELTQVEKENLYDDQERKCIDTKDLDESNKRICSKKLLFDGCELIPREGYSKGSDKYSENAKEIIRHTWEKLLSKNVSLIFPGDSVSALKARFMAEDILRVFPGRYYLEKIDTYTQAHPYLSEMFIVNTSSSYYNSSFHDGDKPANYLGIDNRFINAY